MMTTITDSENQSDRKKAGPVVRPVRKSTAMPAERPVAKSASARPVVFNVRHDLQSSHGLDELVTHPLTSNPLLELAFSPIDVLVGRIRDGVEGTLVRDFLSDLKIPTPSFAVSVGMSPRTLSRRYHELFIGEDAAKVVRYAKVFGLAMETFGSSDKAYTWLERPNRTLPGSATPASLLDTEFGAEEIVDSLHRIQHGVFA